jgi:hypothetical protein
MKIEANNRYIFLTAETINDKLAANIICAYFKVAISCGTEWIIYIERYKINELLKLIKYKNLEEVLDEFKLTILMITTDKNLI